MHLDCLMETNESRVLWYVLKGTKREMKTEIVGEFRRIKRIKMCASKLTRIFSFINQKKKKK